MLKRALLSFTLVVSTAFAGHDEETVEGLGPEPARLTIAQAETQIVEYFIDSFTGPTNGFSDFDLVPQKNSGLIIFPATTC